MRLILQSRALCLLHCAWSLLVMATPLSAVAAPGSFLKDNPYRFELAQAKNCTGAQIEKMIQAGFSKEEIKQLCAGDAPPAAQSGKSDKRTIRGNPLLGTWKAAAAPGEKSLLAQSCEMRFGIVEFREKTYRVTATEESIKQDQATNEALLGKEFSKEWEEMQKELLGGNISSGTTVRAVEYLQDGSEWIVLDPKSGEHIMMVQPVGPKELRIGPCSLGKME